MVQRLDVDFQLNLSPLDRWFREHGDGAEQGLAYAIGASAAMIRKMRQTRRLPTGRHLAAISLATKIPIEELIAKVPKKRTA